MRLLLLLFFLLTLPGAAFSQATGSDSLFSVPVPRPNDKTPTFNILTEQEIKVFTEQYGLYILQVVAPANTFRWNDRVETISFAPEVTSIGICRYDNVNGERMGYMIIGLDESGNLPSKTKTGLFRKVED